MPAARKDEDQPSVATAAASCNMTLDLDDTKKQEPASSQTAKVDNDTQTG